MASNLLLALILMASVITTAHSRIITQLNNGFHDQLSFSNGHELTQIEDSKNVNQGNNVAQEHSESNASIPTGVGDEGFTTESTLVASVIQQYILKAVALRTISNRHNSVGTDEENGPRHTGTGSVGPQRPHGMENQSIESVGPERPTYEPRPIPETAVNNYELTIVNCNFPLCGLPL